MTQTAQVAPPTRPYQLTSFTTRDVPWAKLGATLDGGAVTALEAAQRGGLDFQVDLLTAGFRTASHELGETSWYTVPQWNTVPHRRAVVRRDNQHFMSFASDDYVAVQYSEAFAFMDELNPRYVAAGTLGGGRQAFMVVELSGRDQLNLRLQRAQEVVIDPHRLYVVLRSSHDMTRAIEVCVLLLRGRCMNALTLSSFSRSAQQRWSVRHIGNPLNKLDAARQILTRTDAYVSELSTLATRLAATYLELAEATQLLQTVLPDLPRRPRVIDAIVRAWQDPVTNGFSSNGWGLTNAVSEYFEWGRNEGLRTAESRFTGGLNGQTHRYVNRTAQLLLRRR